MIGLIQIIKNVLNDIFNFYLLKKYKVEYGYNLKINGRLYIRNTGKIKIGNNVTLNSGARYSPIGGADRTRFIIHGKLTIEDNVGISNSNIYCDNEIHIHKDTLIGSSCNIWDTNFHALDYFERTQGSDKAETTPIHIGYGCFIGAHSIILKGTTLAEKTIIPAGTVTRNSSNIRKVK